MLTRPVDFIGIATLISAIGAAVATVIGAIRANRKATEIVTVMQDVKTQTDGINTELRRQNVELKKAVVDPSVVVEQVAGAPGNVSVGTEKGVVTVEPKQSEGA